MRHPYPIAGRPVLMAFDSAARFRPYGRDAEEQDPDTKLLALLDDLLGANHPDRSRIEELVGDCVRWDGKATDEDLTPEERREEQEALRAEDRAGMSARDRRTAKDSRKAARDAKRAMDRRSRGAQDGWSFGNTSLEQMFPSISRIRSSY
jgi:hypothetical protein